MKKNKYPLKLDSVSNPDTPLEHLINKKLRSKNLRKMRFLARFFENFHLKNTVITAVDGRNVMLEDKPVINFSSVNYLGLDQHSDVIKAAQVGVEKWGNHSGCSRAFSSHQNIIDLENDVAELVGAECSLICINVSQTHQGVIPSLFSGDDVEIFIDRFAHTSMHQAALIAKSLGAVLTRVDIQRLDELRVLLAQSSKKTKVLLIDGLYSMQGHLPPLQELQSICIQLDTILYIDDAHGIGTFGENGGGVAELFRLYYTNMILIGSLQKGVGAFGGFVAGSKELIDIIRITCKSYIFSGTLQPQSVEGGRAALRIVRSERGRHLRAKLVERSKFVRAKLQELGFDVPNGFSPIVPVMIGKDLRTLISGRKLLDEGIYLNSVLYPAVPKGEGILRISLTTLHTDEDLNALIHAFEKLAQYLKSHQNPVFENLHYAYQTGLSKILKERYRGL